MICIHVKHAMLRGSDEEVLNWLDPGRQFVVDILRPIREKIRTMIYLGLFGSY